VTAAFTESKRRAAFFAKATHSITSAVPSAGRCTPVER